MSSQRIVLSIVGLSLLIIALILIANPRADPGGDPRPLDDAAKTPSDEPERAQGSPGPNDFWLERQRTIRRLDHNPPLTYDLLVPAEDAGAPLDGWPVVVLALLPMRPYASIAQDGLAAVVKPQFTWNSFDQDRQILDATLEDIATDSPVDNQRPSCTAARWADSSRLSSQWPNLAASRAPW